MRAVQENDDELGRLIVAFNGMLDEIQTRDAALRDASAKLANRVLEADQVVALQDCGTDLIGCTARVIEAGPARTTRVDQQRADPLRLIRGRESDQAELDGLAARIGVVEHRLFLAYLAALLILGLLTVHQIGISWDEPNYFTSSYSYLSWFGHVVAEPSDWWSSIDRYWEQSHEAPPFFKTS